MNPEDTTTKIRRKDVKFFRKIKERKGYASVHVVIEKFVQLIKKHKMEDEI